MPVHKKVNKDFFKKWSNDMAYVLGFFCADGSLTVNPHGGNYIDFHITDKKLLISIRRCLDSEHKISARRWNITESMIYRLQIGSKEMCNDLRTLGVHEKKAYTMTVPHVPKKYFSDFVRGYFDGDGNVWVGLRHDNMHKRKIYRIQAVFTSCSKEFLMELQNRFCTLGFGRGSFYKRDNAYKLQYSIFDSIMLYHTMYDNLTSNLFLNRKKVVFERYIRLRA